MINIVFKENGFVAQGHANYDEYGKDIICAGISSILNGSINWFENIKYSIEDGYIELLINNITNEDRRKLNLIQIQIKSIELNESYKPFLKVTYFNY